MHTVPDFELARSQFRERCNASCVQEKLPFEVRGVRVRVPSVRVRVLEKLPFEVDGVADL